MAVAVSANVIHASCPFERADGHMLCAFRPMSQFFDSWARHWRKIQHVNEVPGTVHLHSPSPHLTHPRLIQDIGRR